MVWPAMCWLAAECAGSKMTRRFSHLSSGSAHHWWGEVVGVVAVQMSCQAAKGKVFSISSLSPWTEVMKTRILFLSAKGKSSQTEHQSANTSRGSLICGRKFSGVVGVADEGVEHCAD